MSEIDITWQDPPPKTSTSVWAARLAPLRERPGTWARIRQDNPSKIGGLRQRLARTVALKDAFEFRTHRISAEEAELYARFIATP